MGFSDDRMPVGVDNRKTPFGVLYQPKRFAVQILVLIGAFAGGPAVAWVMGRFLGGVSENGQIFLYLSTVPVFFFGYALWAARLAALAFHVFGKHLLGALFQMIVKRKKPQNAEDLLPTRDKLEELVVRAQRAAWSFFVVSIGMGLIFGALAGLLETHSGAWVQRTVVATGCMLWGCVLSLLGRRGYLPLPESDE